jgi:hypothetical protein
VPKSFASLSLNGPDLSHCSAAHDAAWVADQINDPGHFAALPFVGRRRARGAGSALNRRSTSSETKAQVLAAMGAQNPVSACAASAT